MVPYTSLLRHKSSSSSCGRAWHRDRLTRCSLHVLLEYSEYPVTEHKDWPTHETNTSTGDAPTPYRPHGTRRERQRSVKVMSHCVHKAVKGVVDDVRPALREGRYENRPSWSHGHSDAHRRTAAPPRPARAVLHIHVAHSGELQIVTECIHMLGCPANLLPECAINLASLAICVLLVASSMESTVLCVLLFPWPTRPGPVLCSSGGGGLYRAHRGLYSFTP